MSSQKMGKLYAVHSLRLLTTAPARPLKYFLPFFYIYKNHKQRVNAVLCENILIQSHVKNNCEN